MPRLISLEEFNRQRQPVARERELPRNGIACPECGQELVDSNPQLLLTSLPPQKNVRCEACDYVGYRLA